MNIIKKGAAAVALLFALGACSRVDDNRIPPVAVRIEFQSVGDWNVYGVGGAMQWKRFIKPEVPSNFPWTSLTYTGFGGVLLVCDVNSRPLAYDLSCPYEVKPTVRVEVKDDSYAECPVCHSTYDIFSNYGTPLSGPSDERGYGLTRYNVAPGFNGEYMVIMR